MNAVNPIDALLWTFRRNEKDVVNLYNTLSPVMRLATGGMMLNFGLWDEKNNQPISAQANLCSYFGKLAELKNAKIIADVGSGLAAPAYFWKNQYEHLKIFCVNINFGQLQNGLQKDLENVNATSTQLPFADKSLDRVVALESAHHFKPISDFFLNTKRALKDDGIFAMALPITKNHASFSKLGIIKFTWSSEHYAYDYVTSQVKSAGFTIAEESLIGKNVYEPLADYYLKNRDSLKRSILKQYPEYVESILFKSIKKMKEASEDGIIDYLVLKCNLRE